MTQITCPYCNAIVPGGEGARLVCPRCGEAFGYEDERYRAGTPPIQVSQEPDKRRSNRHTLINLLCIMFAVAGLTLVFALWTHSKRAERHPPGREEAMKATAFRPADLPALGFLPVDTNLVAAIHVAQLWENPEGKKLFESQGPLDWFRRTLDRSTGIPLEGIDHIAIGTQIKDRLPQVTMVVQTRGSYDSTIVSRKHTTSLQLHKKPLYPVKIEPFADGLLWCPNDHTLVFAIRFDAIKIEDMATIPVRPLNRLESFPEPLREAIQKRLSANADLWAAGHLEDAELLGNVLALAPRAKVAGDFITKVRTFALGLEVEKEATLQGALRAVNAPGAEAIKTTLEQQNLPALKVISSEEEPGWLALQARGSLEPFRETLEKLSRSLRPPAK